MAEHMKAPISTAAEMDPRCFNASKCIARIRGKALIGSCTYARIPAPRQLCHEHLSLCTDEYKRAILLRAAWLKRILLQHSLPNISRSIPLLYTSIPLQFPFFHYYSFHSAIISLTSVATLKEQTDGRTDRHPIHRDNDSRSRNDFRTSGVSLLADDQDQRRKEGRKDGWMKEGGSE